MSATAAGPDAGEEGHHRAGLRAGGGVGAGHRRGPGGDAAQERRRRQVRTESRFPKGRRSDIS